MYSETLGAHRRGAHLRRLQPHVLPAVPARLPRHAAPLLRLSARVPGAQRAVVGGRRRSSRSATCCRSSTSRWSLLPRRARRRQPVGRDRARVADRLAAADAQLRRQPAAPEDVYDYDAERAADAHAALRAEDAHAAPRDERATPPRARRRRRARHRAASARSETAALGMWVFLATEILFFGGLLLRLPLRAHALAGRLRRRRAAHTDVLLGTLNTARAADQQLRRGARGRGRRARPRAAGWRRCSGDRGARRRLSRHQGHRVPARMDRAAVSRPRLPRSPASAGRRALLLALFRDDRRCTRCT